MTTLGIIGTVHTDELREVFHFPLSLLEELIVEFQPDLICGEVRPTDWESYVQHRNAYKGYLGPSEYRTTIIPLCEEMGIDFHPIDWFDDSLTKLDHFEAYSEEEQKSLEQQLSTHRDKRILCTVGFEHNYYYYEELSKINLVKLHYPLR